MQRSLEFLLGLLDAREPTCVAQEDFEGPHGPAVRTWQQLGFVSTQPGSNHAASCPHCGEGVPYRVGGRLLCDACRSTIDPRHTWLWGMDREAFLRWLARELGLRGGVRRLDSHLWQLGRFESEAAFECFSLRPGGLSEEAHRRLAAYRNALVLYGLSPPPPTLFAGPSISLLEVLRLGESLTVVGLGQLLRRRGAVRFDAHSGTLWVADVWLGEVPVGSKEFSFLSCLAGQLDHFVPYCDIKRFVLQAAGSADFTEEATFCQGLKSRIKKKWVPRIDSLIATTNKGDGYRLRGYAGL